MIDEQMIEWAVCDSCAEWHHIACVETEALQSGLVPPANNQYPIDGHGALSCKAQHD